MADFDRVLLYVGAPKTGTTSVQRFLWSNHAALKSQGFYIPFAGRRGAGQHLELPAYAHRGGARTGLDRHAALQDNDLELRREAFVTELDRELSDVSDCHTLLLFSEYMFSSSKVEIGAYRGLFAPYARRFESLMYLRRQDQWLASLTLQARKSGARPDLILNPGSPQRYAGNVRAWNSESDHCHIRRLAEEFLSRGNLLDDFCDVVGIEPADLSTSEFRANPSLFQEQMELVDALNEKLAPMPFSHQIAYRSRFVQLCTETLGGTRVEFARDAAERIIKSFANINRWLHETLDPMGPPSYFNVDFDGYAETVDNNRKYTSENIDCFLSAITALLRDRGLSAAASQNETSRTALVDRMISTFLLLRRAELEERGEFNEGVLAAEAERAAIGQGASTAPA